MTQAAEVLQRIINRENFDSDYTVAAKSDLYSYMSVKAQDLFNALSEEERHTFAQDNILNIWDKTWRYIPYFKEWILIHSSNLWNSSYDYGPEFVFKEFNNENYIIDTDLGILYKEVK
jgi:hypothetical protein